LLSISLDNTAPWRVVGQSLDLSKPPSELRFEAEAAIGERNPCPACCATCKAHDFAEVSGRHLNFFQHHCLIKARVPE